MKSTVIYAHTGIEYSFSEERGTVIELKRQVAKCTGVDVKNQILLMSINDIYSVPKDATLRHHANDDVLLFLFVRSGGDGNREDILPDLYRNNLEALSKLIENIKNANYAVQSNYNYHKQNFLKMERAFSNDFLRTDADVQPLLLNFMERLDEMKAVTLDEHLVDFWNEKGYKTLHDTIPVEKVIKWYEFCVQSRDTLCKNYFELHGFAKKLEDTSDEGINVTQSEDADIDSMQNTYALAKQELSRNISRIKEYQTNIKNSMNVINFLRDALKKHSEHLQYLKVVVEWKDEYPHILTELKRRAGYNFSLRQQLSTMQENQSKETSIRQDFMSEHRTKCMPSFVDFISRKPPPISAPHIFEKLPTFEKNPDGKPNDKDVAIAKLEEENAQLKSEVKGKEDLVATVEKLENALRSSNKISHSSFEINDVALFMPTGRFYKSRGEDVTTKHPIYLAFHSQCPHRYLSHNSLSDSISDTSSSPPDYVLGRIVLVEECTSEAEDGKKNEYCVPPGVKYWVLTVEVIKAP